MTSANKHRKNGNFGISLDTGNEVIEPIEAEVLLGATLSNNFTWNSHIRDGERALVLTLNSKNIALKKISRNADFKTRLMIGTGLIMSSLSYIVQVYGGCSSYLLNLLQVQQNTAARSITKLPWMTSTSNLLLQCNWLSVRQLVIYHSVLLLHRILIDRKPEKLKDKVEMTARETRTSDRLTLVDNRKFKTQTAQRSFIPRVLSDWNKLPLVLREIESRDIFKQELKKYVKKNIPVK